MSVIDDLIVDANDRQCQGSLKANSVKPLGKAGECSGKSSECLAETDTCEGSQLLASASIIGANAADGLLDSGWKQDWVLVFQALCALTAKQAGEGDPAPMFRAERICEEIRLSCNLREAGAWADKEETTRKKFKNAWESLEKNLPDISENLRSRAIKARVGGILSLRMAANHAGTNANAYGLNVFTIDLPAKWKMEGERTDSGLDGPALVNDEIDYLEEIEVHPIPGLSRPLRLSVAGWRSVLVGGPLLLAVVIGGCLSWYLIALGVSDASLRIVFRGVVISGVLAMFVLWLCYPLYRLVRDRIVRAPTILELAVPLGHVLLLRMEGSDRVVRMLRYTAKCPICGGKVTIEKGRRLHRGRLVGECNRNPIEHLYSFDYTTLKGKVICP